MLDNINEIAGILGTIRSTIEEAAPADGREPSSVTLIAVSKAQPLSRIET